MPFVKGDPSQLQNALLNLALNARDAMTEGGTLEFATELKTIDEQDCKDSSFNIEPGEFLQVTVTDTGMGMDKEVLNRNNE